MTHSYRLSRRASVDLDEITAFTVEQWGRGQASRYLTGLESLFRTIAAQPEIGRRSVLATPNTRWVRYVSHIVFYSYAEDAVRIERVLHASRALRSKAV